MDRRVQHESSPFYLHRACAYVPRCTTECERRLVRCSQYPYIENCIDDNVHIALPCSVTSSQKVFLCSPPRSNGTFLVEFAKVPLHERLYRVLEQVLRDIVPSHKHHIHGPSTAIVVHWDCENNVRTTDSHLFHCFVRWRKPDLREPQRGQVRGFCRKMFPPAHICVPSIPGEKLYLEESILNEHSGKQIAADNSPS